MREPFFGFEGINDLLISRSAIESAENALEMRLSPFRDVKDLLEEAKDVMWTPNKTGLTHMEQDVFAIIENHDLLDNSWLEQQLTSAGSTRLFGLGLISVLNQVPTVSLIDFLSLLISKYINHPVAGDIVSQVLDHYTNFTNSFFLQLVAPLNACLNGMIDICLLQGSQTCFQYYYLQATAISESWVAVMRPFMLLSNLKGLGNYRASSVLYNMWSYYSDNCLQIMKEEACFNIWVSLSDVFPLSLSSDLESSFRQRAAFFKQLDFFSKLNPNLEYSVRDKLGSIFLFGETSFYSEEITAYWVELSKLTFKGEHIFVNFVDCRPFEFVLSRDEQTQRVLDKFIEFAFVGLYKRWCGCLCHNLPINFGDLVITNEGITCDGELHRWYDIEIKQVKRDKLYMSFIDTDFDAEFACFDMEEAPNAFMLEPLQQAVQRYHDCCEPTNFLTVWSSLAPEHAINFEITDKSNEAFIISKFS